MVDTPSVAAGSSFDGGADQRRGQNLVSSLVTPGAPPRAVTDGEVIVMDAFLRPRFFLVRIAVARARPTRSNNKSRCNPI
jgi:hypothetical protein